MSSHTNTAPHRNIEIEDLYPQYILDTQLNGKKFNRTNHESTDTEYGKDSFVSKVIKSKIDKPIFDGFKKLFNDIELIQKSYK